MKIAIIVTVEATINAFLREYITGLREHHQIYVLSCVEEGNQLKRPIEKITSIHIPFDREISLRRDLSNLLELRSHLRKINPDMTISFTPKAGLLTALATIALRIPKRIHFFTGQVWVTRKGGLRFLLKVADRLIAFRSSNLLADSNSQRNFLIDEKVTAANKIVVLGQGSLGGVNLDRFRASQVVRDEIRQQLLIDLDATVLLFVGRLNRDKGIEDLAEAFSELDAEIRKDTILLIVGPDEGSGSAVKSALATMEGQVRVVGFTTTPEKYVAASDIFCLPSYREGFGTSVIEAAAAGLPAIASRIYGLTDAVIEGETGLMHAPGSISDIKSKLAMLISDKKLRQKLGSAAKLRAIEDFNSAEATKNFVTYINTLIETK